MLTCAILIDFLHERAAEGVQLGSVESGDFGRRGGFGSSSSRRGGGGGGTNSANSDSDDSSSGGGGRGGIRSWGGGGGGGGGNGGGRGRINIRKLNKGVSPARVRGDDSSEGSSGSD